MDRAAVPMPTRWRRTGCIVRCASAAVVSTVTGHARCCLPSCVRATRTLAEPGNAYGFCILCAAVGHNSFNAAVSGLCVWRTHVMTHSLDTRDTSHTVTHTRRLWMNFGTAEKHDRDKSQQDRDDRVSSDPGHRGQSFVPTPARVTLYALSSCSLLVSAVSRVEFRSGREARRVRPGARRSDAHRPSRAM